MKYIYILLLISVLIIACGKEETPEPLVILATPSISWEAKNVSNDILEIEVTISSNDALPSGKIEFKIDNITIDTFSPKKGIQTYITSFKFNETEEHTAVVYYSFTDERSALNKSKKIKKNLNEVVQKSVKDDWKNN